MKINRIKGFRVFAGLVPIAFLVMGYLYEKPYGARLVTLFVLIGIYMVALMGLLINKKPFIKCCFFLTQVILLLTIEMFSKYAINYFFHSLYMFQLVFIFFYTQRRTSFILGIILCLSSFVKFLELLYIQPSSYNVALFVFFAVIQVLLLLVVFFAKNYREQSQKNKGLYEELLDTHRQLQIYANELKHLTSVEERTKIARDLHDTLGHELTGLIMQMEMASRFIAQKDLEKGNQLLEEAKKSTRGSLAKVREIVDTLKNEEELVWTNSTLTDLVEEFSKKTQTRITCNIEGEQSLSPDIGITLYRIVQEALTNAIRHGKATQIYIDILYKENSLSFIVRDNGKGCSNLVKGNGLKGMIERITLLNGEIGFEDDNGFIIKGYIPYERKAKYD